MNNFYICLPPTVVRERLFLLGLDNRLGWDVRPGCELVVDVKHLQ